MAGEPGFDGRRFVGGVVVEHQMDVEIGGHGLLDLRQEFAEFDRAVALVAAPDDPTTWICDFSSTHSTRARSGGSR